MSVPSAKAIFVRTNLTSPGRRRAVAWSDGTSNGCAVLAPALSQPIAKTTRAARDQEDDYRRRPA